MKRVLVFIVILALLICQQSVFAGAVESSEIDATLHTEGNQLVTASGVSVRLVGLNVPYTSWSDNCQAQVDAALKVAIDDWNSNAVRYPVTPKLWFGANSERYRALADHVIEELASKGKYTILDNHSFYLPDDDDIKLWQDLATRYKDHPYVIFELFNEPAMCTWQQFFEGGELTYSGLNDWGEQESVKINSCGVPELLKTVRATGAKNICIIPGINWSFDLSFCTEKNFRSFAKSVAEDKAPDNIDGFVEEYVDKYFMRETTGNGIMYSTHPYPTKPSDWDTYLLDTILEYPVLVGECGPTEKENGFVRSLSDNDKSYLDTLAAYTDKYELNITPWAWGAWPYLNQEPSDKLSAYGKYMKKYFEQSTAVKAVTLFDKTDYSGESVTLEAGKYTENDIADLGFDLKKLNSVSCKSDYYQYTVTVYEKNDFSGKSYTFVPNAANVSEAVGGFKAKSVEIVRSIPENILPEHGKVVEVGYVENQIPENVIDGKNGTFWKNISTKPCELVICLDSVYALNRIRIAHASEASMMSVFNATDYTVSVSTDGKTFTRIIDVTDNSLGLCEYNFEQVLASYIKISLTKGSIVDPTNYYLAEAMAYGTKYNGSTDGIKVTIGEYSGADAPLFSTAQLIAGIILLAVALGGFAFAIVYRKIYKKKR
ncbi:MAG: cellulase family glycosylhydrolase [Clostridia bacterium]|nr:cellulase family glycosylhydrolase [Clostridia bacterium]